MLADEKAFGDIGQLHVVHITAGNEVVDLGDDLAFGKRTLFLARSGGKQLEQLAKIKERRALSTVKQRFFKGGEQGIDHAAVVFLLADEGRSLTGNAGGEHFVKVARRI